MPRPIPDAAPVTNAVLPARSFIANFPVQRRSIVAPRLSRSSLNDNRGSVRIGRPPGYTSTTRTCTCGFLPQTALTEARTARSMALETTSASRRLPCGRLSKASKIASSINASIAAPSLRALREARDHHVRVARHFALRGQERARSKRRLQKRAAVADPRIPDPRAGKSRRPSAAGRPRPSLALKRRRARTG